MSLKNMCVNCGACCAFFRVSFYWREANPTRGRRIPPDLVEEETEFYDNMKGTNQGHPYCAALSGKIGESVGCTIYRGRPSPCREFGIHYARGKAQIDTGDLERCNKARAAWNLPPLTLELITSTEVSSKFSRLLDKMLEDSRNKKLLKLKERIPGAHHRRFFRS